MWERIRTAIILLVVVGVAMLTVIVPSLAPLQSVFEGVNVKSIAVFGISIKTSTDVVQGVPKSLTWNV